MQFRSLIGNLEITRVTDKISILFVIGSLGLGGKERQLIELIHGLPGDRFVCHLFVKKHDAYYIEKVRGNLSSLRSLDRTKFHILDFLTLAKHIDKVKPDVVCSWTNITSHFCLLARFFSKRSYRLINCCIRNAPIRLSAVLKFERLMYSFYSCVVANSQAGLTAYGQSGKKGRHVLYNGFDPSRVPVRSKELARKSLGFQADQFLVVMVASLTKLKDHRTLLRAVVECQKQPVNIQFLLVGDGTERDGLEKWVKDNGIQSMVSFLGKRDDIELIFRAADLSILTSTAWFGEGISNSIIESMACGTPVIATDSPGTREVIVNNENGYIVDCGDYKGVADKIVELRSQPEVVKEISRKAQECIAEKFSIHQLIDNFEQIVESCSR